MNYNKVISVTGLSGLFELISSKADGAILRSLEDNSTKFVSSRLHNFSHLESIEVYTVQGNVNLTEVLKAIKSSTEKLPDEKADGKALKAYFEKVYPDLDFERVYTSDMKKMIKWFNILERAGIDYTVEPAEGDTPAVEIKPKQETIPVKEGKPVKAASRKIESRGVK
jgi:hypothetical protein